METFKDTLKRIRDQRLDLEVQLSNGSLNEYRRATRYWWENIEKIFPDIKDRPVYFISSNTHSIANLVTGFALTQKDRLAHYLHTAGDEDLLSEWHDISHQEVPSRQENFLYYVLKKYQATSEGKDLSDAMNYEEKYGVRRIQASMPSRESVIELAHLTEH